jgi:hypothetical protein
MRVEILYQFITRQWLVYRTYSGRRPVNLLKPGGFGLFVLPETFIKSDSARAVRRFLTSACWNQHARYLL